MTQPLSRQEQETIIRCSAADDEWDICTADPRVITRLKRAGYEPQPDHQFSAPFVKFTLDFRCLSFRSKKGQESMRQAALKRIESQKTQDTSTPEEPDTEIEPGS